MLTPDNQLALLHNDMSLLVGSVCYWFCSCLILFAIYADIRQGILSNIPCCVYYYEDNDYTLHKIGEFIASLC